MVYFVKEYSRQNLYLTSILIFTENRNQMISNRNLIFAFHMFFFASLQITYRLFAMNQATSDMLNKMACLKHKCIQGFSICFFCYYTFILFSSADSVDLLPFTFVSGYTRIFLNILLIVTSSVRTYDMFMNFILN